MIRGDSMVPDLTPDTIYTMTEVNILRRYDVVVFKRKTSKDKYVKKIYGIPGDLIEYNTELHAIEINNIPLSREDGVPIRTSRRQFRIMASSLNEGFLGSDKYLVFSSNLSGSYDSRTYGAIKKEEIVGIISK
jgi:signal peptidase I